MLHEDYQSVNTETLTLNMRDTVTLLYVNRKGTSAYSLERKRGMI